MEYENLKSKIEDNEDFYDSDLFAGALRSEGFRRCEAKDIANDWERHKDD